MAVPALLQKKLQFLRDKVKIDVGGVDRSSVGDTRPVANWNSRFKFAVSEEGRDLEYLVDPRVATISICTAELNVCGGSTVVKMKGTVRTMDAKVQDYVEARIGQIVEGTALALGARAEVHYQRGYPVTVNAAENTGFAAEVARKVSGHVDTDTPPLMGAEDFSFMLNERPGAYIFLGNGDTPMVHHPAYNFDDSAIPFGSSWYAEMAETRMPAA